VRHDVVGVDVTFTWQFCSFVFLKSAPFEFPSDCVSAGLLAEL
jgi:hypothetical protein